MSLRGKKPSDKEVRLWLLVDGPAGIGKTYMACQFPRPYIIDTEGGCSHYGDLIESVGGAVFGPEDGATDLEEVIKEVKALSSTNHPYKTLVLDPQNVLWDSEVDAGDRAIESGKKKSMFDSGFQRAKVPTKRLLRLMHALDMNKVLTAHQKTKWVKKGKDLVSEGTTFDGYGKSDYEADLWISLSFKGNERIAEVRKSRLSAFPLGETFPWSYESFATIYGVDKLEREVTTVEYATAKQVVEFNKLLKLLSEAEQKKLKIDKVLKEFSDISDMPKDRIAKGIEALNAYINEREAA